MLRNPLAVALDGQRPVQIRILFEALAQQFAQRLRIAAPPGGEQLIDFLRHALRVIDAVQQELALLLLRQRRKQSQLLAQRFKALDRLAVVRGARASAAARRRSSRSSPIFISCSCTSVMAANQGRKRLSIAGSTPVRAPSLRLARRSARRAAAPAIWSGGSMPEIQQRLLHLARIEIVHVDLHDAALRRRVGCIERGGQLFRRAEEVHGAEQIDRVGLALAGTTGCGARRRRAAPAASRQADSSAATRTARTSGPCRPARGSAFYPADLELTQRRGAITRRRFARSSPASRLPSAMAPSGISSSTR